MELEAETGPWKDPIVEEVRSARERLLEAFDFDLEKLAAYLREKQAAAGREGVTLAPRLPKEGMAA